MNVNRLILLLGASAIILCIILWTQRADQASNDPALEDESMEQSIDTIKNEEVEAPAKNPIIKEGDSLWVWNDTFMEFDFAGFYGIDDVKGVPSKDENGDGLMDLTWKTLQGINYAKAYFEEFGMEVYLPAFPKQLEQLNGKVVTVEGFTIPFDGEEAFVALSATPFANCFFCGKGSPASVISLYFEDPDVNYKVDEFKKFQGRLRLNHDDPKEFYYVLEDAKELDP